MHHKLTRVANLHQKADMPDYGEEVYVYGTGCFGWWRRKAKLVVYKQLQRKKQAPHRFLACDEYGCPVHFVEAWSRDSVDMGELNEFDRKGL